MQSVMRVTIATMDSHNVNTYDVLVTRGPDMIAEAIQKALKLEGEGEDEGYFVEGVLFLHDIDA